MKIFVLLLLMTSSVWSQEHYVDLLPLQFQMRYEDANDQTRTNRQYQAYGLGLQYENFRAEFEFSQFYDATGNTSLKIEQTVKEFDLGLGYCAYSLNDPNQKLSLSAFAKLWLGQTQTSVDTTLLGTMSTVQSDKESVLGAGVSLIGRISYFMLETDFKILNSKNMNPRDVPVFALKMGVGIPF